MCIRREVIYSTSHLQNATPPLSLATWHSYVFKAFRKAKKAGADLTSGGMMFHRERTTAEKALLPDLTGQNSLANRVLQHALSGGMDGWASPIGGSSDSLPPCHEGF